MIYLAWVTALGMMIYFIVNAFKAEEPAIARHNIILVNIWCATQLILSAIIGLGL